MARVYCIDELLMRLGESLGDHPIIWTVGGSLLCGLLASGWAAWYVDQERRDQAARLEVYVAQVDSIPGISPRDLGDFARRAGLDSAFVLKEWTGTLKPYTRGNPYYAQDPVSKALRSYDSLARRGQER